MHSCNKGTNLMTPTCCFLCHNEDDKRSLYRVCNCDTVIHADCFSQLVKRVPAHSTHCPVCCAPYRTGNVWTRHEKGVCFLLLLFALGWTAFGAFAVAHRMDIASFALFAALWMLVQAGSYSHVRQTRVLPASLQQPESHTAAQ